MQQGSVSKMAHSSELDGVAITCDDGAVLHLLTQAGVSAFADADAAPLVRVTAGPAPPPPADAADESFVISPRKRRRSAPPASTAAAAGPARCYAVSPSAACVAMVTETGDVAIHRAMHRMVAPPLPGRVTAQPITAAWMAQRCESAIIQGKHFWDLSAATRSYAAAGGLAHIDALPETAVAKILEALLRRWDALEEAGERLLRRPATLQYCRESLRGLTPLAPLFRYFLVLAHTDVITTVLERGLNRVPIATHIATTVANEVSQLVVDVGMRDRLEAEVAKAIKRGAAHRRAGAAEIAAIAVAIGLDRVTFRPGHEDRVYGNSDIISRGFSSAVPPRHAPCNMRYHVRMVVGC